MEPRATDFTSSKPTRLRLSAADVQKDVAAFVRAGGEIELLGNTPLRGRTGGFGGQLSAPTREASREQ